MLKRKFYETLVHWKQNHKDECLLVNGARQVGKTESVRHFARQAYTNLIEINFVKQPRS